MFFAEAGRGMRMIVWLARRSLRNQNNPTADNECLLQRQLLLRNPDIFNCTSAREFTPRVLDWNCIQALILFMSIMTQCEDNCSVENAILTVGTPVAGPTPTPAAAQNTPKPSCQTVRRFLLQLFGSLNGKESTCIAGTFHSYQLLGVLRFLEGQGCGCCNRSTKSLKKHL